MSSTYLITSPNANTFSTFVEASNCFLNKFTPSKQSELRKQFRKYMKAQDFDAFWNQFIHHYKCHPQKRVTIAFLRRNYIIRDNEHLAAKLFDLFVRNNLLYANGLIRTDFGKKLIAKEILVKPKTIKLVPDWMLLRSNHKVVNLANIYRQVHAKHPSRDRIIARNFVCFFVKMISQIVKKYGFRDLGNLHEFTIQCANSPMDMYFIMDRLETYLANLKEDHSAYSLKFFLKTLRDDHEITQDESFSPVTREVIKYASKNMIPFCNVDEFDKEIKSLKKQNKLLINIVRNAIENAKGKIYSVMYFLKAIKNHFLKKVKLAQKKFLCTLFRNYSSNIEIINQKIVPMNCKNSIKFDRIIDHEELYTEFGETVYRMAIQKHLHKFSFMPHRSEFRKWLAEELFIKDEVIKQLKRDSETKKKAEVIEAIKKEEDMKDASAFDKLGSEVKPLMQDIIIAIPRFPLDLLSKHTEFTIKDGVLLVTTKDIARLDYKIYEEKEKKNNDYGIIIAPQILPVLRKHNITQVMIEYSLDDIHVPRLIRKGMTNEVIEKEETAVLILKQMP